MEVQIGNIPYFMFLIIFFGGFVGLVLGVRKLSMRARFWLLWGLLVFNLVLQFTSPLYLQLDGRALNWDRVFLNNICAVSAVFFPFIYLSKSRFLKTGMVYLGIISGVLAVLIPTEAIDKVLGIDVIRFYLQHMIIGWVPMLMPAVGLYEFRLREIFYVPLYALCVCCLLIVNDVVMWQMNLKTNPWKPNNSFQWGFEGDLSWAFAWLTPKFMYIASAPYGMIPFVAMIPSILFWFSVLPFIVYLIYSIPRLTRSFRKAS